MKITQQIERLYPAFFVLLGGMVMGCTPAPVGAWYFGWIGMIPLWLVVLGADLPEFLKFLSSRKTAGSNSLEFSPPAFLDKQPIKKNVFYGCLWGLGYHGLAISWITGIHPLTWMGVPWLSSLAIAAVCWMLLSLTGALFLGLWVLLMQRIEEFFFPNFPNLSPAKLLRKVLIGTALWCLLEGLFSMGDLWWTSLSYTQSPVNLAILQLGKISGPNTITAAIVSINGLLAAGWLSWANPDQSLNKTQGQKFLAGGMGLLVTLHVIGGVIYVQPIEDSPEQAMNIGIIQGNIPNSIKLYPEGWRKAIEGYTSGYEQLADQGVAAVLTPETALPFLWSDQVQEQSSFYRAILTKGVMAWVGGFGREGNRLTNSLFTITGRGEIFSQYNKVKLVPLGEYIPFEQFIGQFINRLSPLDAKLQAGTGTQIFDTPLGRAIVGICYESAFSQHFQRQAAAGGEFIITASNNSHYGLSMPAQHHAQDVLRAVEVDRWAVRATNTGYSGIVDPHGNTLWISGINTYATHAHTVYRRQTQTWYTRWKDWLTPLLLLLGFMAAIAPAPLPKAKSLR
jgi:apolipoprotein N-acyltransferase